MPILKRVTMKDVAQAAGVSITTVSHVVNATRHVDSTTRARVLEALDNLGYFPNSIASSLRSGKTKIIGLIVPDASNPFFADVSRQIENIGYQQGYSVILCNSDNDPAKQSNYINTLLAKQVDGVIFISAGGAPGDLIHFSERGIPVVVADRDVPLDLADVVLLDNEQAGYDATQHLIELGHTRIACITGPNHLSPSMQRVEGFRRALREHQIPCDPEMILPGDFRFQSGEAVITRLLAYQSPPTAVFVLNDMMAIGAMTAVRKHGFNVPGDISIVGFDDIELASAVTPALTTIAQPMGEIARHTTDLLISRLQGDQEDAKKRIVLSARLVIRDSTAARKG
ncbi:MAG: LacI family DNA-binding transcriptional regulator [Chloroflexota bacterium]